jgi:hypothetical protein
MSQIQKKATSCACGTSFKASTPAAVQERQEKTCTCCGGSCGCMFKGTATPNGNSCCCGNSCNCGG